MNFRARSRLTLLIVGMAVLAAAIFWSAIASWRGGRDVKERIESVRSEGAHTSNGLRDGTIEMRSALLSYEVTGEAAYWRKFQELRKSLQAWLEAERAVRGESEAGHFDRIDAELVQYVKDAETIAGMRTDEPPKEDRAGRIKQIHSGADTLVAEGAELFATRRHALQSFVSESEKFLVQLQQLIFASLLMLLIFGAWGVRVIYRDMISPLRVRLIETREIAERQEKLAALGVLAAGVAHEIRNPLTAIKARLYTLQKTLPVESAARRDAEFIGKEIDRLARIIADFLTFARPAQPRLESISAAELMSNAGELLAPGLLDDEIALVVEPAPGLKVSADAGQLQQVLINLVQNAAESIGKRGTISLRARSAELPLSGQIRDVVILEVEDTGKGIPREVQERLFDPFFTTKASGMGLGLSIAARIVEMHGGAIQYQTQVARGAKFGVVLPDGIAK